MYVINRSPSVPLDGDIPQRVWTDKDVSYRHLRVFDCLAYMHISKDQRRKLDPKTRPCIFLGYGNDEFGYRLWNLAEIKVIRSRDIVFMEEKKIVDWEIENKSPTTELSRVNARPTREEVDSIEIESEPVDRFNTRQNRDLIEEQRELAKRGIESDSDEEEPTVPSEGWRYPLRDSSANCRDIGSNISLSQRPSSHKCLRVSSIVRKRSNTIALWSTPTVTSAFESWWGRFCPASAILSVCILLEVFWSRSDLSDPWLWGGLASAPRSWCSIRRTSSDSSLMSRMLMQSVSVCETLFGVDYEPWYGAAVWVTSYRSSRISTQVESVSNIEWFFLRWL